MPRKKEKEIVIKWRKKASCQNYRVKARKATWDEFETPDKQPNKTPDTRAVT
jgi:hypothetical protein